jgi:glycosyltransferase involved in cell wall biosynthesis
MITSFIFVSEGLGIKYGVGKYLSCLKKEIAERDDISINVVVLGAKNCTGMKVVKEAANINMVYYGPFSGGIREQDYIKKAEEAQDTLQDYFKFDSNAIFHFIVWSGIFIAMALKKRCPNPVIFDLQSLEWQFALDGNKRKFDKYWNQIVNDCNTRYKNWLKPGVFYEKQLCGLSDHIIVRTNQMKNDVIETYKADKNKISVIPNGIEIQEPSIDEKEAVKEKLGFTSNERIILFAGRVCDQKGVQFLIRAFKLLLSDFKNIRLVIAGSGYYDNYLKECENTWSKVTFTGRLDTDTLNSLYRIADIGVVPSLYEPFGYVILEMMLYGIPVISTNIEGPNDIIVNGATGFKVKVMENEEGNRSILPGELSEKVKLLLNNPLLTKSITKNASARLKEQFSSSEMTKNIETIYRKLIF